MSRPFVCKYRPHVAGTVRKGALEADIVMLKRSEFARAVNTMWHRELSSGIRLTGITAAVTQGCVLGPVHSTPEEFENGGFIQKTHQLFSVHSTPEEYYKKRKLGQGNHVIIVTSSFSKCSNFKIFSVHTETKSSSGLKSVFEKLGFRDGLVWTLGLTVAIKLRFQILLRIVHVGAAFGRVLSRSTVSSATSLGWYSWRFSIEHFSNRFRLKRGVSWK